MKPKMTLCLAMILEVAAAAQGVRSDDATAAFRKLDASVEWNVASAEIADVGCDGKPDTVMLGYKKDEVAVGIVFAAPAKKAQPNDGEDTRIERRSVFRPYSVPGDWYAQATPKETGSVTYCRTT
jgi:hypothetical protein